MILMTGPRLVLRDMTLDDLKPIAHWMHPDHEWHRLDGPYYPKMPANEIPEMVARLRDQIHEGPAEGTRRRLMIAQRETGAYIGQVTRYWISEETNWTAQGIAIHDPTHWGQGYGYEALGLWSQYLFDQESRFVRLDMRTWSGNRGMMRLAEKLGYTLEARFRKARIVDGEYYDGLGYGVLREEWATRYPDGFAASL
jgi:putative hydrolase of HD superfamily